MQYSCWLSYCFVFTICDCGTTAPHSMNVGEISNGVVESFLLRRTPLSMYDNVGVRLPLLLRFTSSWVDVIYRMFSKNMLSVGEFLDYARIYRRMLGQYGVNQATNFVYYFRSIIGQRDPRSM